MMRIGWLLMGLSAAWASDAVGTWRGKSTCTTSAPACKDESVVYYIKDVPERPDVVMVQADKMGRGEGCYDGDGRVAV